MAKDLYAILGLARGAGVDEIKKAYRRMSKEWHPDKHKGDAAAEEKFKEINEAYETLSNPQKKQMYDQFGTTGGAAGGPNMGGFDFSSFSGNMGDFGTMFESLFGGNRARAATDHGTDREIELTLELRDVIRDNEQVIRLRRLVACGTCGGTGAEKGSQLVTCETCGGTGQVVRSAQSFFGVVQQRTVCPDCKGSGKIPQKPCPDCSGEGRRSEQSDIAVTIPAGIADGQTLRLRGQGDAGRRGAAAGDLYVHIRVRPDARFERDGADIHSALTVPVLDALLGADLDAETVHGAVTLHVPEGTQPGQVLRIKGKGLPVLSSSRAGDHYVTVRVEIPKKLSRTERGILEEWRRARE